MQDSPGDNPAPGTAAGLATLLLVRTNPGSQTSWVEEVPHLPATLPRFGVSQKKGAGNFLEAASCCIPGPGRTFQQLLSTMGDPLPQRSGQTLAFKDLRFLRAGMSGRSRQHSYRLGKGTACPSELIWDGWMSPPRRGSCEELQR